MRLAAGFFLAPSIVAGLVSMVMFFLEGASQTAEAAVLAATVEHGITLLWLTFGYTATLGAAGVAVLWALRLRGLLAWTMAGLLTGAVAGLVLGPIGSPVLLVLGIMGCAIFLLIRAIAGISAADRAG